jgi:hypothetical protein
MSVLATMAALLYRMGFKYLAVLPAATSILIFGVKSMETIKLEEPKQRLIVGARCLVVSQACRGHYGIVRLYTNEGALENETWSAELAHGDTIEEGRTAKVVGMRSIVLIIERD